MTPNSPAMQERPNRVIEDPGWRDVVCDEPVLVRLRRPCHIGPSCSEALFKRLAEHTIPGPPGGAGMIPCPTTAEALAELK